MDNSLSDWVERIEQAYARIKSNVLQTPLLYSHALSTNDNKVYLKLESEQYTGSFKARGALNKVLLAKENQLLVTASTGNHAQGMARALQITQKRGIIFMPEDADESKKQAVGQYGVEVKYYGTDPLKTELHAREYAQRNDAVYVSPYNDIDIIAGQGTIAIELLNELENLDLIYVTIGGGGLASGIASYIKARNPNIKIIGCLPERSPDMYACIQAGKIITIDHPLPTLSDGSAGGLEEDAITFDICSRLIDEFCIVSEDEIAWNMKEMVKNHQKIIEGAAGVAIAAYKQMVDKIHGKTVAIIVCGGNVGFEKLMKVLKSD